jgi:hypothetical protein
MNQASPVPAETVFKIMQGFTGFLCLLSSVRHRVEKTSITYR